MVWKTLVAAVTLSLASVAVAGPGEGALSPNWIDANVRDGFTVTAVGDLIMTQPTSALLERTAPDLMRLLRSSDVTFGNFEGTAVDLHGFGGYPAAQSGGGWLLFSPKVPADLKAMGFTLVNRANNHATDWGVKGLLGTDRLLDEAGLVHAGSGETLSQARAPARLTTSGGRVAMVGMASRFEADSIAADPLGEVPGRPGINGLRTTRFMLVSPERLAQLAAIRDAQPAGSVRDSVFAGDRATGTVTLFGGKYRASATIGNSVAYAFIMNPADLAADLRSIRDAKQSSDFTIATLHAHEPGNYDETPPDFLPVLAHKAIDEGADMFIGHGPHQLRGIEIYKGKPIFYSLGNFFFMYNNLHPLTRDEYEGSHSDPDAATESEYLERQRVTGVFKGSEWFESVVAKSRFDARGNVTEIRLYPVELHWTGGRDADRGLPRLAPPAVATRILARLQVLSFRYGTQIQVVGNEGVIKVPPKSQTAG
ncbi:CapA family protein [Sphingomonas sp. UYP23]